MNGISFIGASDSSGEADSKNLGEILELKLLRDCCKLDIELLVWLIELPKEDIELEA